MQTAVERRRHLALLGFYALATLLLTWPLALQFGRAIPGDAFDGWQNYWNLWWVKKALLEQHTHPYFTTALYHPTGVSLWFQTLNVFNGFASLPMQLAGNLFWAYNGVVLFSFVMSGYGATLLALYVFHRAGAKRKGPLYAAALLAGTVYTFSPFHFAHLLGHMQVFSFEFVPFFVLYLLKALDAREQWLRPAVHAALFLVLAALCDWYFALYMGWLAALYLVWLLGRRALRGSQVAAMVVTFLLALVVLAPLLVPMVRESMRYNFMRPPEGQIANLSADVLAFVLPSVQHPVWGKWVAPLRDNLPASTSENTLYLGVVPVALAVYGLWRRRLRLGVWVLASVVFGIFALGPELHVAGRALGVPMPYALLLKVPFVEIARTVARYGLLVMLGLGLLAGGGLYVFLERGGRGVVAAGLMALMLFEYLPAPYPVSPPDTPEFYRTLAADPRAGAVMNVPMNWDRPGYLLYQTTHGKPLTAGYISRTDPRTYPGRLPVVSEFRRLAADINGGDAARLAPTVFEFLDVRWVISDRYKMPGGEEREVTEQLLERIFEGESPVYEDERITVYETRPPVRRLAFVELGTDWGPWQPGPARAVEGRATLVVHSPAAARLKLAVTPAPPSVTRYRLLDSAGKVVGESDGQAAVFEVQVEEGANHFALEAAGPGLVIRGLELLDEH
ncbi:MAG: hypothetical protein D6775_14270 [Caldilineae bacterium]|nr:MAG: hypothetical protein D6775_14270 [Caldilineae bacterium]